MGLQINKFNECDMCGECCKIPCDLVPENIDVLLDSFDMSIHDFFKRYLIALPIASQFSTKIIFEMVPVKVDVSGKRINKYVVDDEYMAIEGQCIFLKDKKCIINNIKPMGGKLLICSKMTGLSDIQFNKDIYYNYWYKNQHLFKEIIPEESYVIEKLFDKYTEVDAKLDELRETHSNYEKVKHEYGFKKGRADNYVKDTMRAYLDTIKFS